VDVVDVNIGSCPNWDTTLYLSSFSAEPRDGVGWAEAIEPENSQQDRQQRDGDQSASGLNFRTL
jgi:hypothetical protein